jgi:hypothetical protein
MVVDAVMEKVVFGMVGSRASENCEEILFFDTLQKNCRRYRKPIRLAIY